MTKAEQKKVVELLRNDEEYYNGVGRQYRSNSDIYKLLNDPEQFGKPTGTNINFLIGGYLHTAILEPEKLKANYPYVDATTRTTKIYKEAIAKSGKEMLLLKKEVDRCEEMITKILNNDVCTSLLRGDTINEEPGIKKINGTWWKGKADCINKDQGLLVDIKTTGDINKFKKSANIYNYDSQAFVYKNLFGYDMLFMAIDKNTGQIGIYDCSENFYKTGFEKVEKASEIYDLFFNNKDFDPNNYFINKTL